MWCDTQSSRLLVGRHHIFHCRESVTINQAAKSRLAVITSVLVLHERLQHFRTAQYLLFCVCVCVCVCDVM